MQSTIPFSRQQRITNTLLLNASFIDNLGLMHGKMGIAIYFFHLARETKNPIYEDYAGELIDEIYDEISTTTPLNFENGLAGIGWGIEYLVQNGFIEADTNEVLEEFDKRIIHEMIYHTPNQVGLLNGLVGLGVYFLKRIRNTTPYDQTIRVLSNKQTLIHLIDVLEQRLQITNVDVQAIISNQSPIITNRLNETSFGVLWEYPMLLYFLAELIELNIDDFNVRKIIMHVVEPILNERNLPILHINQLILVTALTKLLSIPGNFIHQDTELFASGADYRDQLKVITERLLSGLTRDVINSELVSNNDSIKRSRLWIYIIYNQLHKLRPDNQFKLEMEYWEDQHFRLNKMTPDFDVLDTSVKNGVNTFYIMEGLAGPKMKLF